MEPNVSFSSPREIDIIQPATSYIFFSFFRSFSSICAYQQSHLLQINVETAAVAARLTQQQYSTKVERKCLQGQLLSPTQ